MAVQTIQSPDTHDLVWVAASYLIVVILAYTIAKFGPQKNNFFLMFSSKAWRVIATIVLMSVALATSLYYIEYAALILIPALFLASILFLAYRLGQKRVSAGSGIALFSLLLIFTLPLVLTLIYQGRMTSTISTVCLVSIGLFWFMGIAFSFMTRFRREVQPRGKTRTNLLLIVLTFYVLLYAARDWGGLVVGVLALMVGILWLALRNETVMSARLSAYNRDPMEIYLIATTMMFAAILNFTLMLRNGGGQGTTTTPVSQYWLNIVMFAVVMAFFLLVSLIHLRRMYKKSSGKKYSESLFSGFQTKSRADEDDDGGVEMQPIKKKKSRKKKKTKNK